MNNPAPINSDFALVNPAFFHAGPFRASSFSPPSHLATFGIQTGREKKAPPSRLSKGRSWRRARVQRQRSSRQINLRRDLRPRTSLSACIHVYTRIRVYTRAHLRASRVRARPYGSGAIVHRDRFRGCVELNDEKRRMDQLLPILP